MNVRSAPPALSEVARRPPSPANRIPAGPPPVPPSWTARSTVWIARGAALLATALGFWLLRSGEGTPAAPTKDQAVAQRDAPSDSLTAKEVPPVKSSQVAPRAQDKPVARPAASANGSGTETRETWAEEDNVFPRRKVTATYVNGKVEGKVRCVDENDRLICIEPYVHGVIEGERITYYPSGSKFEILPFKKGQLTGTVTRYFDGGGKASEQEFVNGVPHGRTVNFFRNGKKASEGQYLNGQKHGRYMHYLVTGEAFGTADFIQGQQVGQNVFGIVTEPEFLQIKAQSDEASLSLKDHWSGGPQLVAGPPQPEAPSEPDPKVALKSPKSKKDAFSRKDASPRKDVSKTLASGSEGAVAFGGKRYKFFPDVVSWTEARAQCEHMGGRLAIVTSKEQNETLAKLVQEAGKADAWLGATDEVTEGSWVWIDGSPLTYSNWAPGQPNNKKGVENYLLLMATLKGQWADQPNRSTDHKPGFLCEWNE